MAREAGLKMKSEEDHVIAEKSEALKAKEAQLAKLEEKLKDLIAKRAEDLKI